ncbi:MAG: DUF1552 domain-containing protein [Archangiaceae bacterium]|nr:DUF1552 domain-containing protein [Archangiaceae bacterium]
MTSFTRRAALKFGALGALFPWTRALAATPKRKLLLYFTPHGTIWPKWRPTGTETSFTLSPILTPLANHKSKLSLLDGLSLPYGTSYYIPHTYTMPTLWTGSPIDTAANQFCRTDHMQCFGWGTGTSVDQTIAAQLPANETTWSSIELGYNCGGQHPATRMIYSGPRVTKGPIDDPARAFSTLFTTVDPNAAAAAAKLNRRRSVLDTVVADLGSRKGKMSAADKSRLDAHATAVRELEVRLAAEAPMCTYPGAPTGVNSQTAMDRQADIAAAALGCGLTRVLSMQMFIADNDNSLYPWLGVNAMGHHALSHDSSQASQDLQAAIYTWYSARFAYLLDRLAATPDPAGGSVLDNTLVVWGSELGTGWTHDIGNVPFVIAGGPTVVQGGRYKKVTGTNHRVLVTATHAMGFTSTMKYGALDNGTGPLSGVLVG